MKHVTSVRHTIYRESHGESIQDVTLEGTFGVKVQPINSTSQAGRQVHQALEQLITNDRQRLKSKPTLQVESHEHAKTKHTCPSCLQPILVVGGIGFAAGVVVTIVTVAMVELNKPGAKP